MIKLFRKSVSHEDFADTPIQLSLDYIKSHPEEYSYILEILKTRLTFSDTDKAYVGELCLLLEEILQQTNDCFAEVLDILQLIYAKYQLTALTLLINIAYKDSSYAPQVFEILEQWLKANYWSEGKLINLYQLLYQIAEKMPFLCDDIFRITSLAVLRSENDSYCKSEAQKLFSRLVSLQQSFLKK